jgi:Ca2+-binding EF-hand superfamily protein
MAISDAIRKQLVDYIMLQVYDDQYIDRKEERQILEMGIKKGLTVDEGLSLIQQLASEKGFVIEREAEEKTQEVLKQFATNDGVVDQKEFQNALSLFKKVSKGKIPEPELKRRLKNMMQENYWKAKEGGLFGKKWFSEIS